jgi:autoinducer 2 (AI-2) kinase
VTEDYVVAIDAGTGSCRAVLFDRELRQVGFALREWVHREPDGIPGGQDFEVNTNWGLITECVREVLMTATIDPGQVAAVAATSMREGIVVFDASGRETFACPNVDARATEQAEELVSSGDAERIYRTSGDWVSITSPARIKWLAAHRPAVLESAAAIGMLSDWVTARLCGVHVTEPSCGSSSGMFELAQRTWSPLVLGIAGLPEVAVPPVTESGVVVGSVTARAAGETGLRVGTPVVAGGADTQLALLGAGIGVAELTVVAGTFWQTTALLAAPVIDPLMRLRTLCHVSPGQWMLEGIGFYSGMSMRWARDALCQLEVEQARLSGADPYDLMEALASRVPAGSNGVLAILSDVMNARHWVHASPTFTQLDLADPQATGRAAMIRSIQESAVYVTRAHRELITELSGLTFERMVFTGGAAKGRLWPQIVADVHGLPVHIPEITESTARGAGVCAGVGIGWLDSFDSARQLQSWARVVEPHPADEETYDSGYQLWHRANRSLVDLAEAGVMRPLWRAPGADASGTPLPTSDERKDHHG